MLTHLSGAEPAGSLLGSPLQSGGLEAEAAPEARPGQLDGALISVLLLLCREKETQQSTVPGQPSRGMWRGLVGNLSLSLTGSLEPGRKQKVLFSFSRWFCGGGAEGSWDAASLMRKLGAVSA